MRTRRSYSLNDTCKSFVSYYYRHYYTSCIIYNNNIIHNGVGDNPEIASIYAVWTRVYE